MALFDRWTAREIASHEFFSWLHIWLYDSDGLGSIAASRAVTSMALEGDDITEAQAIKAKFDALPVAERSEFVGRIHAAVMLSEAGKITEAEAKTLLGF